MALAVILKHPTGLHFLVQIPQSHNPIGFKKSWHIPAIQAEEMVEGYKELERGWQFLQSQHNPTILLQSSAIPSEQLVEGYKELEKGLAISYNPS